MNELVIDTSVVCKWFMVQGEGGVEEARALLGQHRAGSVQLIAPASLPLELANALRYSRMNDESAENALEDFHLGHIRLDGLTYDRLASAIRLARRHDLSVYDALFLALAEERGCPLVTADHKAFARLATDIEIRLM